MTANALRWLVRDVFRQARATGLTATLAACTAAAVVACLTVHFSPDPLAGSAANTDPGAGGKGTLTTLFGYAALLVIITVALFLTLYATDLAKQKKAGPEARLEYRSRAAQCASTTASSCLRPLNMPFQPSSNSV